MALRALIGRIGTGDKAALAGLYDQTRTVVFGLILRIVRDPQAAEETTLDVYLQAYHQAAGYDPARGSPMAWLMNLARSRAIDRLRKETPRRRQLAAQDPNEALERAPAEDEGPSPPLAALLLSQTRAAVQAALGGLSDEQRQVIVCAYYEGLSCSEIAGQLALPIGTVKSRLRSAIINLKQHLGPLLKEPSG